MNETIGTEEIIAGKLFKDLTTEVYRAYTFPNDQEIVIEDPLKLHVSLSGGHYIITSESSTVYIPPGWLKLEWQCKQGQGAIQF